MVDKQLCQGADYVFRVHLSAHRESQADTGIFINDREDAQGTSITGPFIHKVITPDMVSILGPLSHATAISKPETFSFGLFFRYFKPFFPPDPFHPFVVGPPAFVVQQAGDSAIAIPTIVTGQLDDSRPQALFIFGLQGFVSKGGSGHPDHFTGSPFRYRYGVHDVIDCPTSFGRA
jgi:hypothetical protein